MVEMRCHSVDEFPFDIVDCIKEAKCGRGKRKRGRKLADAISAFDIETTKIPDECYEQMYGIKIDREDEEAFKLIRQNFEIDQSVMFCWQFHLMAFHITKPPLSDEEVNVSIICRTWEEFLDFMIKMKNHLGDKSLLIYDFNFNYEFTYLKGILDFTDKYNEINIFAKNPHCPLYAYAMEGTFEFRDAYSLYNTNLAGATEGLPHAKLSGKDFDYTKKRFFFTELTPEEEDYAIFDVYGLCESIKRSMKDFNDTVYSIPLTSTGYVRRDVNAILYQWNKYNGEDDDYDVYNRILLKANRGGSTHCSRYFAGKTYDKVSCYDISSSYPAVMQEKFPLKKFQRFYGDITAQTLIDFELADYAYLAVITLNDVRLHDIYEPVPYLTDDKSYGLIGNEENDNGRITACECCTLYVTDEDWKIIRKMYDFDEDDFYINELYISKYEYLPQELRDYIIGLYKEKTSYKDRVGVSPEGHPYESLYRACKPKINGIFGLSDMRVLRDSIYYDEEEQALKPDKLDTESMDAQFDYYRESKKRVLKYRIGTWVCAKARRKLQEGIWAVSEPGMPSPVIYCDTDSIYVLGEYDKEIEALNEKYKKFAISIGAYADDVKGHTHYLGTWENDKQIFDEYGNEYRIESFRSLGAKKYCYTMYKKDKKTGLVARDKDGNKILKTVITTAGVPKEEGGKELVEKGGLDAFEPGLKLYAGKLTPKYNDNPTNQFIKVYDHNGKEGVVEITPNCCLLDTSYEFHTEKGYQRLLDAVNEFMDPEDRTFNEYAYYVAKGYIT